MTPSGVVEQSCSVWLFRLAQHLFHPPSSILDRNVVNWAVNCSVNSISDDSQEIVEILTECVCVCVVSVCARVRAAVMSFAAEVQRKKSIA